jgi:ComF family protein
MDTGEDGVVGLCQRCVAEPPKFVKATAWGDYEDLRQVIHMLKFDGVPGLARPLGRLLASAILSLRSGAPDALVVVPVPLYRGKREYNQSMLLASSASKLVRNADPTWSLRLEPALLKRVAHTESQYLLSPAQRRENVRNAFAASPRVQDRHVLLIDDVYTTGATAAECTRVLLKAGAASVRVATLARAVRDGATRWKPSLAIIARNGPGKPEHPLPLF